MYVLGRNMWICAIHGSHCAIYGSIVRAGIHGSRRVVASAICRSTGYLQHFFFFSVILFPLLCGFDVRWHTPPCSTVVHIISRQSLLFDIILYCVQPSSLSFLSSLFPVFQYHRPPSYVVVLSSHHMPIPPLPLSLLFFHF